MCVKKGGGVNKEYLLISIIMKKKFIKMKEIESGE